MFMSGHKQMSDNTNVRDVKTSKRWWEKGSVLFTRKQNTMKHFDGTDVQPFRLSHLNSGNSQQSLETRF